MADGTEDTMFGLTDAELDVRFAEAVLGSSGGSVSETGLA